MSQSDNQILEVVGGDDDEEVDGIHDNDEERNKKKKTKKRGFVCTRNFRRAKQVVLSSLSNFKRKRKQQNQPHQINTLSSSSSTNAGLSGTTTTKGCCFCFTQPHALDSPVESLCSDPNDPNFSYDMFKSLIENNDFYSKESNPHLHFHPDYLP